MRNIHTQINHIDDFHQNYEEHKKLFLKSNPKAQGKSQKVLKTHILSRYSLLENLKKNLNVNATYHKLDIVNHHYIFPINGTLCSLSHTDDVAISAIAHVKDVRSIGVDIELQHRDIPEKSAKYFVRDDDDQMDLLKLWVIKEACFKATWPLWKRLELKPNLVLNDIHIQNYNFYVTNTNNITYKGRFAMDVVEFKSQKYIKAVAWLPNLHD